MCEYCMHMYMYMYMYMYMNMNMNILFWCFLPHCTSQLARPMLGNRYLISRSVWVVIVQCTHEYQMY